ncbi:HTTM domain-containing protein [Thalassobaculum sp. OXR-137]|uniref:HTTM domain-containing protein n=1 Tax=Thalassobaculum sp. OXR-137 TaxID=3100173 RepID=UPI002AC935E6|nr:HTTM domain-containing protein [Thalassobaculum sp. OXR-137]WPZ36605.1 HTTM domain-containing protein [Thalassobaculum sp. OXR-137]
MSLDDAIRLTEILLAVALIQQSLEHLVGLPDERPHYAIRLVLAVLLMVGVSPPWICAALFVNALVILRRFQGPYNGGSDLLSLLLITALFAVHLMPSARYQEYVFGYLALQVIFSYFKSGLSKVVHADWRSGRALRDVFLFSVYPVSEATRRWAERPRLLCAMSWAVVLLELLFPLALIAQPVLIAALAAMFAFHGANFVLFGFNRFVWVWLAAYPSLIWLQARLEPLW